MLSRVLRSAANWFQTDKTLSFVFTQAQTLEVGSIAIVSICLTICYWSLTLLYVLPESPLRKQFGKSLSTFEHFAYQKWTFFAPPPTFNNRLEITYTNRLTLQSITLDPLSDVIDDKRSAGVLNAGEEALDYVISGSIDQVARYVATHPRTGVIKAEQYRIADDADLPGLKTLKKYAYILAKQHQLNPDDEVVSIMAFAVPIPVVDFDGRVSTNIPTKQLRFSVTAFRLIL